MEKEKREVTVWIEKTVDKSGLGNYAHITAKVMYKHGKDDTIRNWHNSYDDPQNRYFEGLTVSCQQDDKNESLSYGWNMFYANPWQVNFETSEKMTATLKFIRKNMDKMNEKYGGCSTFTDYIIRFFHAVKADDFCFTSKQHDNWLHTGEYRFEKDISVVKSIIDGMTYDNLRDLENPHFAVNE